MDKSGLYKYRNEFSKDMELPTKASEVARSAPVVKADDERDIEAAAKDDQAARCESNVFCGGSVLFN